MPVIPKDNIWGLTVKRDGAEWKDFEIADVERFEWRGALNEPPTGRLVVLLDDRRDAAPVKLEAGLGSAIEVVIAPPERDSWDGETDSLIFAGELESADYLGQADGRARWEIAFRHKAHRLMQKANCRFWGEASDYGENKLEEVVRNLLSEAGLNVKKLEASKLARNAVVQYRETDFNFLLRLVEDMGFWIDFHPDSAGDLSITKDARGDGEKLSFANAIEWSLASAPTPNELELTSHANPLEYRVGSIIESAKAPNAPSKKAFGEMKVRDFDTGIESKDNAKIASAALLGAMTRSALTVRARAYGSCYLPGELVELDSEILEGVTGLQTKFLVTESEVVFTAAGIESSFSGHLTGAEYLPPRRAIRPRIDGVVPAIVTTSDANSEEHGRVRVKFPWGPSDQTQWVRVARPWAGKDRTVHFLPLVDDEVLVAFEHGDPSQPIIIGSLHNSDKTLPLELPGNWTQSLIQTRTGHKVTFEDKDGAQFIEVESGEKTHRIRLDDKDAFIEAFTGGGHHLKMDDTQELISLKSAGGHELLLNDKGKKVQLRSSGGAELTMDDNTQTVTLKVGGCKIEMAPAGITISAAQVTVKGDAKVAVEGAMTEVKGSGMLTLKGGMTMIN